MCAVRMLAAVFVGMHGPVRMDMLMRMRMVVCVAVSCGFLLFFIHFLFLLQMTPAFAFTTGILQGDSLRNNPLRGFRASARICCAL
jgi:hypothetical protein